MIVFEELQSTLGEDGYNIDTPSTTPAEMLRYELKSVKSVHVHLMITSVKPSTAHENTTVNIFKQPRLALPKLDMQFTRQ